MGVLHLVCPEPALYHRPDTGLVDGLGSRWVELLVGGVLRVAEEEHDLACLAWGEEKLYVMGPDRGPTVRDRVEAASPFDRQR